MPISYWDQRQDACDDPNRQFEWSMCGLVTTEPQQGIVKSRLGQDGLPVPAYTSKDETIAAGVNELSQNVTGNDPVRTTDNFYR